MIKQVQANPVVVIVITQSDSIPRAECRAGQCCWRGPGADAQFDAADGRTE